MSASATRTGLPAVPPDWGQPTCPGGNNLNPTHSICPTPLTGVPCPVAGQIRVNGNKCVAPCTKPGEVMTPDGDLLRSEQCCGMRAVLPERNGTQSGQRNLQARTNRSVGAMACKRKNHLPIRNEAWRRLRYWCAAALVSAPFCFAPAELTAQQTASPVYSAGNAAVTGFSGALPPVQIAPGVDPDSKTFIDLNGPSLRVVDLQNMGGPAQAQLVRAPKLFTFSAASIGQVFGVAMDDNAQPNIYAAASSAYGLPIVAPGADGQPEHIQVGAPHATFMPGLWGPQGGPGSIWKIDGITGKVSLLANVTLGDRTNSGAALGGLAYDPDSKSLYVADRENGLIHHLAMNGSDLGSYDHGVAGRASQGLPPVPWNSQQPIDITSPQFDSTQPASWNYAAAERRIFGLAVYQHRLYYAVADSLQIWSVGLSPDGSFGDDAVIELVVPPAAGPTEISKITFDEQGRMFLADRPAPTGAFDFEALAVPGDRPRTALCRDRDHARWPADLAAAAGSIRHRISATFP